VEETARRVVKGERQIWGGGGELRQERGESGKTRREVGRQIRERHREIDGYLQRVRQWETAGETKGEKGETAWG
jgi:hypothetical protein